MDLFTPGHLHTFRQYLSTHKGCFKWTCKAFAFIRCRVSCSKALVTKASPCAKQLEFLNIFSKLCNVIKLCASWGHFSCNCNWRTWEGKISMWSYIYWLNIGYSSLKYFMKHNNVMQAIWMQNWINVTEYISIYQTTGQFFSVSKTFLFLAVMSSSKSDIVIQFVLSCVCNQGVFSEGYRRYLALGLTSSVCTLVHAFLFLRFCLNDQA